MCLPVVTCPPSEEMLFWEYLLCSLTPGLSLGSLWKTFFSDVLFSFPPFFSSLFPVWLSQEVWASDEQEQAALADSGCPIPYALLTPLSSWYTSTLDRTSTKYRCDGTVYTLNALLTGSSAPVGIPFHFFFHGLFFACLAGSVSFGPHSASLLSDAVCPRCTALEKDPSCATDTVCDTCEECFCRRCFEEVTATQSHWQYKAL